MYVGDAAGREKGWKPGKSKDFSCGDRSFALNIEIPFKTPEEFFLDEAPVSFKWDSVDPEKVLKTLEKNSMPDLKVGQEKQELVLLVGCPASGKSTFSKTHFVSAGYVHVNQDTLKTKPKCIKATEEAIQSGKSVVVDNTNPDPASRAEFTKIAKAKGVPYRCIVMETDVDLAHHLNFYREKITKGGVRRIPDVAYNMFKSKYKEPTTAEGFKEVLKVKWVPEFASEEHKRLFLQRT